MLQDKVKESKKRGGELLIHLGSAASFSQGEGARVISNSPHTLEFAAVTGVSFGANASVPAWVRSGNQLWCIITEWVFYLGRKQPLGARYVLAASLLPAHMRQARTAPRALQFQLCSACLWMNTELSFQG